MRFSVIMPLYNKAAYVANAIQSVLSQTFTDYELIIVDDGSKDNSAEVAEKAIEGYGNCRLIRQENTGVSIARNNGMAASQGDYLCFLDADDWWEPTFLEEIARLIIDFPGAGLYGTRYTIVHETRRKTRVAPIGLDQSFERGYINYCQVYAKTLAMPFMASGTCVPRPVFEELGGFPKDIEMGEDFILWIHVSLRYKVVYLNKPLTYYNQDVDASNRAVGRLHVPERNMYWNLTDLEPIEKTNEDYKKLIDNLRTYALLPYYLSKEYHEAAKQELAKVDWEKQPMKTRRLYKQPLVWLRLRNTLLKIGAEIKFLFC